MKNCNIHLLAKTLQFRKWVVDPSLSGTLYTLHEFWQPHLDSKLQYGRNYPEKLQFRSTDTYCFTCKKFTGTGYYGLIFACDKCLDLMRSRTAAVDVTHYRMLSIYSEFMSTLAALPVQKQQEFWGIVKKYYGQSN